MRNLARHAVVVGELFPSEDRAEGKEDDPLAALDRGDARCAVRVAAVVDVPRLRLPRGAVRSEQDVREEVSRHALHSTA